MYRYRKNRSILGNLGYIFWIFPVERTLAIVSPLTSSSYSKYFLLIIYWLFFNLKMIIFVFLCNTGYSKPNGTGVQVSRCLWILVTNHKIILFSRLFIPKMEFNFLLIHIHASDFHGTHHLTAPWKFVGAKWRHSRRSALSISYFISENIQLQIAILSKERGGGEGRTVNTAKLLLNQTWCPYNLLSDISYTR